MKRHVAELRDAIRNNWSTTGQELGRELRQFWQPSRQNSPAPSLRRGRRSVEETARGASLEVPGNSTPLREVAGAQGRNNDFAAGYAMGLIGGVKSWVST